MTSSAANPMSIDEFLGHDTRVNRSNYLDNWKKRQPPEIDVWLHTHAKIISLWQHNWPRLVERVVDDRKVTVVWGGNWNCHEPEEVLKRQYFRDRDSGQRVMPPAVCPLCLVNEAIRDAIEDGKVKWTDVLFRFVGEGADEDQALREIHAGGIYNAFGRNDLSDAEVAELRKAGIRRDEAWRENATAKCNYVFSVVDGRSPEDGVQVAVETTLLGDKVKEVIRDAKTALGVEEGNPIRHPYAIRWKYAANSKNFSDRYKAVRMDKLPMSEEVRALIYDSTPPDVTGLIRPGNPHELRASMEQAYVGPEGLLDFDALFAPSVAEFDRGGDGEEQAAPAAPKPAPAKAAPAKAAPAAAAPKPAAPKTAAAPKPAAPKAAPKPAATATNPDADDLVACDECDKEMSADDPVCPHCGFEYEAAPAPPPPPPAPRRSRSEVGKGSAPAARPKDGIPF